MAENDNNNIDPNDEELRALLKYIRTSGKREERNVDDESARDWSKGDVDNLLKQTGHKSPGSQDEDTFVSGESDEFKIYDPDNEVHRTELTESHGRSGSNGDGEKIRAIMDGGSVQKKKTDISSAARAAGRKISGVFSQIRDRAKDAVGSFKLNRPDAADSDDDDDDFEPPEEFEDEEAQTSADGNPDKREDTVVFDPAAADEEKTRVIDKVSENGDDKYIEKPGIVIKKAESGEDPELERAPTIMSADTALETEDPEQSENDDPEVELKRQIREAMIDGQIVMSGFEDDEETPVKVDEEKAEQELFEKRREKLRRFTVSTEEEGENENSDAVNEKLGELFEPSAGRSKRSEKKKVFTGVEYSQTRDSRRVRRYLDSYKKHSANRLINLSVIFVLSLVVAVASSVQTTVAGDRILTIFANLVLTAAALMTSNRMIFASLDGLKNKRVNINTGITLASLLAFIQNIIMLIIYFVSPESNTVSVFSATATALLLMGEAGNYLMAARTSDAMRFCTGENRDMLYSLETINEDKDAQELGRYIKASSARIRYSSATKFPAHLIEYCMSETSTDKAMTFLLPITGLLSVINLVVSWVVSGDFATGFAAFSVTASLCVPALGAALIQLPLRWSNKRLNSAGALISGQEQVEDICRTNMAIVESAELFDRKACEMKGFKDFKNVRVDDFLLYAAAMVICSGGPLTEVFDQIVVNRRDILPPVKSFKYEEKLGISGWIYDQKVVLGNRELMENHNIELPADLDVDKYRGAGYDLLYLAIAHKPAAMFVVRYRPNKRIAPMLRRLRDIGVTVLVMNNDPNVTEEMLSDIYGMNLSNVKIMNSSSARIFKKYKARTKTSSRAVVIHDGGIVSFFRSLCTADRLKSIFKISSMITYIGSAMSFAIVLMLSIFNVISDFPAVFALGIQLIFTLLSYVILYIAYRK